jgi:hypothetical protein
VISGCATTKPPLILKPERVQPTQAMEPCQRQLCVLRESFDNLTLDEQGAMLLACRIADAEAFRSCSIKQDSLRRWIESAP